MRKAAFCPNRVLSYYRAEWKALLTVTVSGLIYNVGLLAAPWFEGKLAGCLVDVLREEAAFGAMLRLVCGYVLAEAAVQGFRCIKRFSVRRFANNVNRRMKKILYGNLLRRSRAELEREGAGSVITKAIADADDCSEGMRKFTTEIFDTGVAMICYTGMLLHFDGRLALMTSLFPPIAYFLAEKMKTRVQSTGAEAKRQAAALSAETLDRASNALTYRVFGCEGQRGEAYERRLTQYERAAVRANFWTSALPPLYRVICMAGTAFILYFGARNVLGQGWTTWDVAAFTTFLSCYTRLSVKSSRAAKLFNAVHKAQLSWGRIRPFLEEPRQNEPVFPRAPETLTVENLSFAYDGGRPVFENLSFSAEPGQIIGITGPVACGKSTLGKAFLCEYPYSGSVRFGGEELKDMSEQKRRGIVGYLGHDPELMDGTVAENVLMGDEGSCQPELAAVCLDEEVRRMPEGENTVVGSGGVRLSGGQAQRLALARTLHHGRPLLILDDPFSALDRTTEAQAFEHLKDWAKDAIVLLISHRLYLFPQMDQVIWMDQGRAEAAAHGEMMEKQPLYAELYRAQEGGAIDEA